LESLEKNQLGKHLMKFLCDQMLIRLGRWLRAAGYDTEIVNQSKPDKEILAQALKEERLLITRDSHFVEMKGHENTVIWLKANHLSDCIKELNTKISIHWLHNPFSRCLVCNQNLIVADQHLYMQLPDEVRNRYQKFWFCPSCKKLYWLGSHTSKMLQTLHVWQKHV
jgi:uncharacterized protein